MEIDIKVKINPRKESTRFTGDVVWQSIAQLFSLIIFGIAILPMFTKTYSSEVYGIWAQSYVTVTLLSPILCLELDMAVVRFLSGEDDTKKRRKALGSMLFVILIVSITAIIIVSLMASKISVFLFANQKYFYFVHLTSLWVVASALFVFFGAYLRARNMIRLLSVRQVVLSVIILIIVIILTAKGVQLEWVIVSVVAIYSIFVFIFFTMIVREIGWPLPNLTSLRTYLAFSIPQIPNVTLLWLITSSDRYFITHFINLSEAGIYTSSNQLASLIRLFYAPVIFALYPLASKLWDENRFPEVRNYLQYATRLLMTLGIPAVAGITLLSQPLLKILTTSEYLVGRELVFFIAIGAIFLGIYQINGHIILLAKKTKLLPLITAFAAIISIAANALLIPHIGIIGAALSNIMSFSVLAIIMTLFARKTVDFTFDFVFLAKIIGATIPLAVFLYFIKINGIVGISISIILGIVLYIGSLYIVRAFSEQDKQIIRNRLSSLTSTYLKKK
jgi:O-antigen/teichoic acid export membrane protein